MWTPDVRPLGVLSGSFQILDDPCTLDALPLCMLVDICINLLAIRRQRRLKVMDGTVVVEEKSPQLINRGLSRELTRTYKRTLTVL